MCTNKIRFKYVSDTIAILTEISQNLYVTNAKKTVELMSTGTDRKQDLASVN